MLPGLLLSIFFWAIHQFINADVKDLCENIQLNVFDHPLAAFNALYGVFIVVIFKIMILIRRYEIDFDPFFRRSSSDVACTALFLFSTPIPSEKSSNYRK